MNVSLAGRTALITGASKGLGLATAIRLAQSGARVAIVARGQAALSDARARIEAASEGCPAVAIACDVLDPLQIESAYREAREALGPIDILINNAGGHALGQFTEVTDAMWAHDLDVKLMATVRFTRLCWPDMQARRWGRVINTLNTLAKAPIAGGSPTAVTRAAQLALTKVLANEGGPHNILVNALLVGLIKSHQIDEIQRNEGPGTRMEGYTPGRLARIPLGRIGEADEFANIACFLASDAASYITGSAIGVDGGMCPAI